MAHEITSTDRYSEVRSGGKRAWHQLGEEIREGLGAVPALIENGSDWTTSLEDIFCYDASGELVLLPSHKMHVRDDNGAQLGMVSAAYKKFDNLQVAEFADALCGLDHGISVETIGTLRGGKRFFILVKLPDDIEVTKDDVLAQYVLLSNGHGGVAAFAAYPTAIRVCCANTLRWSERDVLKGCRFQHTGNLDEKLGEVQRALGIVLNETELFKTNVVALGATDPGTESILEYFGEVYDATELTLTDNEKRRDKVITEWSDNMDDVRQLGGGSLWTAYNAVSQWYDHERGRFKTLEESPARANSNLFGTADKFKRVAFKQALSLV